MLAHAAIRASDRSESERFYRTVLGAIGVGTTHELDWVTVWDDFAVLPAEDEQRVTRHLHLAFAAQSHEQVDTFWQAGVDAGYQDDGAPGLRPQYGPDYYGGFLLDPDGNSAEAVSDPRSPANGNIDHLWIGVRDLSSAESFYTAFADYTGFAPDHRWEAGHQYRSADGTTFSVIEDGRPPTENLHLAFPARDRHAVDEFHRAALGGGHQSNGDPGARPQYGPTYYAAFVLDPDGTNVELVSR